LGTFESAGAKKRVFGELVGSPRGARRRCSTHEFVRNTGVASTAEALIHARSMTMTMTMTMTIDTRRRQPPAATNEMRLTYRAASVRSGGCNRYLAEYRLTA
jgi:hypothetical protein